MTHPLARLADRIAEEDLTCEDCGTDIGEGEEYIASALTPYCAVCGENRKENT